MLFIGVLRGKRWLLSTSIVNGHEENNLSNDHACLNSGGSDEGLTLETLVLETLYGEKFTSSTHLTRPNDLAMIVN